MIDTLWLALDIALLISVLGITLLATLAFVYQVITGER